MRDAEIEDFLEGFNQPTYRGVRINGERVPIWSSQHGWSGETAGRMQSGSSRRLIFVLNRHLHV
jgi:hypothetical protein